MRPPLSGTKKSIKNSFDEKEKRMAGIIDVLPNKALEPTPTASARASLRLLAWLTASVRRPLLRSTSDKKAKDQKFIPTFGRALI